MSTFVPKLWADAILKNLTESIDRDVLYHTLPPLNIDLMNIDPDLEAFFVAVALQHGTHPKPLFGIERTNLARSITELLANHEGKPKVLDRVRRNYAELGGKLLDTDPTWFYSKLADAYLDWLYSQEESKRLLPAALDEAERRRVDPTNPFQRRTIRW